MATQLDIFSAAAEDDAIPDTTWPAHYGPWRNICCSEWDPSNGPHPTWEAYVECWSNKEDIEVYRDRNGFRAVVSILRDSSTGLWLGAWDVSYPTGGASGPSSYSPAAYRSKEACIEAWKVRAMEKLEQYRTRHDKGAG